MLHQNSKPYDTDSSVYYSSCEKTLNEKEGSCIKESKTVRYKQKIYKLWTYLCSILSSFKI